MSASFSEQRQEVAQLLVAFIATAQQTFEGLDEHDPRHPDVELLLDDMRYLQQQLERALPDTAIVMDQQIEAFLEVAPTLRELLDKLQRNEPVENHDVRRFDDVIRDFYRTLVNLLE